MGRTSVSVAPRPRAGNWQRKRRELEMEEPTLYQELGGGEGLRALVESFYDAMERLPAAAGIRAMHAPDLQPMREALFDYLSAWLGGPTHYFQRPDAKCIRSAHAPYRIGLRERDAWMQCMDTALKERGGEDALYGVLHNAFTRMADMLRNDPEEKA